MPSARTNASPVVLASALEVMMLPPMSIVRMPLPGG
jgi:hypothetical protein